MFNLSFSLILNLILAHSLINNLIFFMNSEKNRFTRNSNLIPIQVKPKYYMRGRNTKSIYVVDILMKRKMVRVYCCLKKNQGVFRLKSNFKNKINFFTLFFIKGKLSIKIKMGLEQQNKTVLNFKSNSNAKSSHGTNIL